MRLKHHVRIDSPMGFIGYLSSNRFNKGYWLNKRAAEKHAVAYRQKAPDGYIITIESFY
jgi:hypothetical protein